VKFGVIGGDEDVDVFIKPAENILELEIEWSVEPLIEKVLPVFKRWKNLRRLTLLSVYYDWSEHAEWPPLKMVRDFIMNMKHLTYLGIGLICFGDEDEQTFVKKVNDIVKPRRPDFIFEMPDLTFGPSSSDEYWYSWPY
jgi:hypothetical protein